MSDAPGRLIAIEGVEGAGKSTQARLLAAAIGAELTREPGGTPLGEQIRALLLQPGPSELDDTAELLLMLAARAQHLRERIEPALQAGRHVVVDRFSGSTLAYQGYGRGIDLDDVRHAAHLASGGRSPQLNVLIDVPVKTGAARRRQAGKLDRIEAEAAAFHERVRDGFFKEAGADPDHWCVVDGERPKDELAAMVLAEVTGRLGLFAAGIRAVTPDGKAPVLDRVVGQPAAVAFLRASLEHPVHAYLFVGPPGTGRVDAAVSFAAALFCPDGGCGSCTVCKETLARRHPDLVVVERQGAAIDAPQAREVVRLAARSPRSAPYQVLVLVDFHLVGPAGPTLLKPIEEPPASSIIVVTAESVPADFMTIASRCLRVDFPPLGKADLVSALLAEGAEASLAEVVAEAAEGRLDRARLLVRDESFVERMAAWKAVPPALDGTGATVARLVAELLEAAGEPVAVVEARQAEELEHLTEEAKAAGDRGLAGRADIEARHRRERRRARTDDIRAGLAALSGLYRERLGTNTLSAQAAIASIASIEEAASRLVLNVDETLLLEWLLLQLDRVG